MDEIASLTGGSLSVNEIRDLLFSDLQPINASASNEGGGQAATKTQLEMKIEPLLMLLESSGGDEGACRALDTIESEVKNLVQEALMKMMTHR